MPFERITADPEVMAGVRLIWQELVAVLRAKDHGTQPSRVQPLGTFPLATP